MEDSHKEHLNDKYDKRISNRLGSMTLTSTQMKKFW
jgi:hypothetical protein